MTLEMEGMRQARVRASVLSPGSSSCCRGRSTFTPHNLSRRLESPAAPPVSSRFAMHAEAQHTVPLLINSGKLVGSLCRSDNKGVKPEPRTLLSHNSGSQTLKVTFLETLTEELLPATG